MRLILLVCALVAAGTARAEIRSFELQHAAPEELLAHVEALLGPYESVSVFRGSLVVNAGDGALERVARLVAELDRPRRNLLIRVRRHGTASDSAIGVQGSAELRISTNPDEGSGGQLTASGGRRVSTRERGGEQSIRALEGSAVQIRDGQLLALARGGWWGPQLDYTELQQGFVVRARVNGETVTLDLHVRDERVDNGTTVRAGGVQTTLSGALGEWIWLGGTRHDEAARIDGTGRQLRTRSQGEDQYEVLVELGP